jgi:hypothetical protein
MKALSDDEIPPVVALGRQIAEQAKAEGKPPPQPAPGSRLAEAQRIAERRKLEEAGKK